MCRRPPVSEYKSLLLAWILLLAFSATAVPRCSGRTLFAGDCPRIVPCPFLLGVFEGNSHYLTAFHTPVVWFGPRVNLQASVLVKYGVSGAMESRQEI